MHRKVWLLPLAASIVAVSSVAIGQDQVKQQDQTQKQDQASPPIYGSQLMTQEERAAYRAKMRSAKTPEEREKVRVEHHEQMKARAKEKGVTLPDAPPPMGGGMGPGGGGMGPGGGMGGGRRY